MYSELLPIIQEMREALEFYAQEPVPDKKSAFAKSAMEWGENVVTWEPLTDMGERGRETLERLKGVLG